MTDFEELKKEAEQVGLARKKEQDAARREQLVRAWETLYVREQKERERIR